MSLGLEGSGIAGAEVLGAIAPLSGTMASLGLGVGFSGYTTL
jgi:hypothetical protein